MDFRVLTEANGEERIYIAGPEVFYHNGQLKLGRMKLEAQAMGFEVTMPNGTPILTDVAEDPNGFADEIFENCARSMNRSTALIIDLEDFRGAVPDGGSVFELGMAWARGMRCYAFSRDCRPAAEKDHRTFMRDGVIYDALGLEHSYPFLPFSATVMGSAKLVEGTFSDSLKQFLSDLSWDRTHGIPHQLNPDALGIDSDPKGEPTSVYVSTPLRFSKDAAALFDELARICAQSGCELITAFPDRDETDPHRKAGKEFRSYMDAVSRADVVIVDVNDYLGLEPNPDVSFEAGAAYQLGKRLYGFMSNTQHMLERVPHHGKELGLRDSVGREVEFYDYPLNLMFASSMPIRQGNIVESVRSILDEIS